MNAEHPLTLTSVEIVHLQAYIGACALFGRLTEVDLQHARSVFAKLAHATGVLSLGEEK